MRKKRIFTNTQSAANLGGSRRRRPWYMERALADALEVDGCSLALGSGSPSDCCPRAHNSCDLNLPVFGTAQRNPLSWPISTLAVVSPCKPLHQESLVNALILLNDMNSFPSDGNSGFHAGASMPVR